MNTLEEKIARIPVLGYARRHDGYPNPLLKREVDARIERLFGTSTMTALDYIRAADPDIRFSPATVHVHGLGIRLIERGGVLYMVSKAFAELNGSNVPGCGLQLIVGGDYDQVGILYTAGIDASGPEEAFARTAYLVELGVPCDPLAVVPAYLQPHMPVKSPRNMYLLSKYGADLERVWKFHE